MKFSKKYEQYMQGTKHELPAINIKKMKKTMKRCRRGCRSGDNSLQMEEAGATAVLHDNGVGHSCPDHCAVCDETLFPSLLKEMSTIVGCFNQRAKKLLELHLATGLRKYVLWVKGKTRNHHHSALIQEVNELVMYAIINSIAMKKILKKYDKIHHSKQGQAFRTWAQVMHIEILHSPWLCELMAFYINNKQDESLSGNVPGLFEGCSLTFEGGKPSLSCGLFDSLKLNVDLTCSICLDTVFDPIALTCGHIFCYICACGAASVSIIDGLRSAEAKAKCPLCRQAGVFESYVRLTELNILLRNNCHEYWEQRLCSERQDRVRQAKEYWESQCRAFMGM